MKAGYPHLVRLHVRVDVAEDVLHCSVHVDPIGTFVHAVTLEGEYLYDILRRVGGRKKWLRMSAWIDKTEQSIHREPRQKMTANRAIHNEGTQKKRQKANANARHVFPSRSPQVQ